MVAVGGSSFDVDQTSARVTHGGMDDMRRAELIELGKARLDVFSWKRCAEQTLDIYRRIAA